MTFLPKPETTHWRRPNTTNTGKGWAREFTERERERKQKKRGRQEREREQASKDTGSIVGMASRRRTMTELGRVTFSPDTTPSGGSPGEGELKTFSQHNLFLFICIFTFLFCFLFLKIFFKFLFFANSFCVLTA